MLWDYSKEHCAARKESAHCHPYTVVFALLSLHPSTMLFYDGCGGSYTSTLKGRCCFLQAPFRHICDDSRLCNTSGVKSSISKCCTYSCHVLSCKSIKKPTNSLTFMDYYQWGISISTQYLFLNKVTSLLSHKEWEESYPPMMMKLAPVSPGYSNANTID